MADQKRRPDEDDAADDTPIQDLESQEDAADTDKEVVGGATAATSLGTPRTLTSTDTDKCITRL